MVWRGRGLVPDCLGWLRLVGGPEKSLGCKRWVAIGLALLRFPIGPGLEFAHRYTQSQAVIPAYRGSL